MYEVLGDIVEDYGLVSFETLAVEDRDRMLHLVEVLDRAIGYIGASGPRRVPTAHEVIVGGSAAADARAGQSCAI
jgi:hypothetical protein